MELLDFGFRKMTRIGDRSINGDHGLQVDKLIFLANVKHCGIGCLFGIWFIINGIIYWFSTLCWKDVICEDLIFEYLMDGY